MTDKTPNPRFAARSNARMLAVQALYERTMDPKTTLDLVHDALEHRIPKGMRNEVDVKLFGDLLTAVVDRQDALVEMIRGHLSKEWTLERLDLVVVAILKLGLAELLTDLKTPSKAIINDYVSIANSFFDGKEPGFVNGLLDAAARKIRPQDFTAHV